MHGRHSARRANRKPIEPQPMPQGLARAFDLVDAAAARRRRERPLNCSAFDAIDRATAPRISDE